MSSSAQHHSTFCTFDEVARPQIFSIVVILATTIWLWSLSLAERATSPPARPPLEKMGASRRPRHRCPISARLATIGTLLAIVFLPAAAHALSSQATTATARWKSMNTCAIQAQRAFPDFTAESNAKRDAKLRECLAGQNLPPRETASPAQ